MQTDSLGKVLPQVLLPFVRQWAQRSGISVVSRILEDEQFRVLVEKYADELIASLSSPVVVSNGNGHDNGNTNRHSSDHSRGKTRLAGTFADTGVESDARELAELNARVVTMEQQLETQQSLFEMLRSKARPMALALGCCPECVVGVFGCSKCMGQSTVGLFPPDRALLRSHILDPLTARGVPITVNNPRSKTNSETRKNKRTGVRRGRRSDGELGR